MRPRWTIVSVMLAVAVGLLRLPQQPSSGRGPSVLNPVAHLAAQTGRRAVPSPPAGDGDWKFESDQPDGQLGRFVGPAGDVNGDGFDDVIMGAPYYDGGQVDEGRAYVFHGSATGLHSTPDWTFESDQAGALLGDSVWTAEDVNGDGFDDVIVGANLYDDGQVDEGRAYVFHGSPTGLSPTPNWIAEGDQAGASFGEFVWRAGDVNGDGFGDVIIGAPAWDDTLYLDEGKAFAYYGSPTGLGPTPSWMAVPNQSGARFGQAVSTAGDVNGDGFADVLVGADFYDHGQVDEGATFAYYGSPTGLRTTPSWRGESDQEGSNYGYWVDKAGDVNGDGFGDVIIGANSYTATEPKEGRTYVYEGSATGLSLTPSWTADGHQRTALFGYAVGTAGDVNGDGFDDVIITAERYDNPETNEGQASVYYGSASGLSSTPSWTTESNQARAQLGYSAGAAGDVNGDGFDDVIIGVPLWDNPQWSEGEVIVHQGSATSGPAGGVGAVAPTGPVGAGVG